MNIEIDKELCVGCGLCEENAPKVFKIGTYTAELRTNEIPGELESRIKETAEDCPANAITIS